MKFLINNWYIPLALLIVLGIGMGNFYFQRWVHYKMGYQSLVREEVRDMVKHECLN